MPFAPQQLPTRAGIVGDLARQLLRLVGPGWQAPDDSTNAADALALGASLADERQMLLDVWAEIFPDKADETLDEWERMLGLRVARTLPTATRRTRLLAFVRATLEGTPQSIESAVAAYAGTCDVVETDSVTVYASDPSPTDDTRRGVFRFAVVVPVAIASSAVSVAEIRRLVHRMKPAHTDFTVTNHADGFLADDPDSLTDLTVLTT